MTGASQIRFLHTFRDRKKNAQKIKETIKLMVGNFMKKEYVEISEKEKEFHSNFKESIRKTTTLSSFLPWSFYETVRQEMSGSGYATYFEFINFVIKNSDEFTKYILDMRHNNKGTKSKIKPFLKPGENVFTARPSLPEFNNIRNHFNRTIFSFIFVIGLQISPSKY